MKNLKTAALCSDKGKGVFRGWEGGKVDGRHTEKDELYWVPLFCVPVPDPGLGALYGLPYVLPDGRGYGP